MSRIPNRYPFSLSFPGVLLLLLACSEFNHPVQPTHFISSRWSPDTTEYTIAFFGPDYLVCTTDTSDVLFLGPDVPTLRFFVNTATDFSERIPAIDFSNSDFLYEAFIVDSFHVSFLGDTTPLPYSRIHLVRLSGPGSPDTVPISSAFLESKRIIDIQFSDSLIGYPDQLLWQAYFYQPKDTLAMPPEPYGYIVQQ